jgi:predicted transport protein
MLETGGHTVTFQAYIDNIKAKTGKTPDDFKALAKEKGLTTHAELMAWLKSEFGLGHGHASAITHVIRQGDEPRPSSDDRLDKLFTGAKTNWRPAFDALMQQLNAFGSDISTAPTNTYISLLRGNNKFGIVQVSANRMDIGIKSKATPATDRLEEAGTWNNMVTHRVRIEDAAQVDAEVLSWLRQAYDQAG